MFEKIKNYLKLIRVTHYIKNCLIFLPLFFGGFYKDVNNIFICIIGFILFSLSASIVYVINDICDIEKDKKHEIKKHRPLASGAVSKKEAYTIIGFLVIIILIIGLLMFKLGISVLSFGLIALYVVINILYSKWLKNIPLVDIVILVSGFLIRVFYGAIVIDAEVSNWLYLTIMSAAFYMGFGKRRNEIIKSKDNTRKVLKYYNKEFLDRNMYVCLTLTIVFYAMWTVDPNVVDILRYNWLIWTVPLIMLILFQYSLIVEKDSYGDPVDVILHSKPLLLLVLFYIICIFIIFL